METKLNNPGTLNNESQQKDNVALKTAGMAVGGSVIGAGAAYGATQAYQHLNNSDDDPSISEVPFDREKKDEETEKKDDNKQEKEEKTEEVKKENEKETEKEEVHDDVNGGKTVKDNGSKDRITEDDPAEGLDNVNPDLVAHEIIDGEFVDPNDIDLANFPVEEVGIIETVDGQEISAASFIGEDGEQLFLVDVDNDNNYDYIVDANGVPGGRIESTFTTGDAESIIGENDDEFAYNDDSEDDTIDELNDDIENDIVEG